MPNHAFETDAVQRYALHGARSTRSLDSMAVLRISIDEVEIDGSGGILVRPRIASSEHYEYIYRTASGVRWMPETRALAPYETKDGTPAWWFRQIVAAVRDEYGQVLVLQPDTRWINVSNEHRREIEAISDNAV